jgi:hypothetical protein
MQRLRDLIGNEHPLDAVSRTLTDIARRQQAAVVGALHVTCSDECERECSESLQQWFVDELLPEMKLWHRSAFRTANLGSQYEWGSIAIAEHHYATPPTRDAFKVLLVKINAHVCVHMVDGKPRYGQMPRYEVESTYCGALHALLAGVRLPAVNSLQEEFLSEGKDRIAMLCDPSLVDPSVRALFAAIASARLQARRAVLDIQDGTPASPTCYVVLPCVTINRHQRDTELVVGLYTADYRQEDMETASAEITYVGLGDDPSQYVLSGSEGHIRVDDPRRDELRAARDHRQLVAAQWQGQPLLADPDDRARLAAALLRHRDDQSSVAKQSLTTLLGLLVDLAPVPTAVELFVGGACGINHFHRAYRLSRGSGTADDARRILDDAQDRIESLPAGHAAQLVERLATKASVTA